MSNKRTSTNDQSQALATEAGLDEEHETEAQPASVRAKAQPARPTARAAAAPTAPAESLTRNVLFCLGGLILGFLLGFFFANKLINEPRPVAATNAARDANGTALPLDPSQQASGQLPPGHPDISGMNGGSGTDNGSSAAASSADAQQAMAAADAKPKDFELQMSAATVFYEAKDYAKAELYLQRALALKPKDPKALAGMGNTKYDQGDFTGAADYYQRALAVEPKNTDVQTDYGNTFYRRTPPDYARAIKEYRKTLAIDPKHERALQNMAAAALFLKDKATAKTAIDQLAAVNPNNPALASLREALNALP
jgi:tetratricopeptide (TPR) repeat protein